ncbi:MAG TPA: DNA polymerase III subunit beta [Candidatus Fermentibacter daniensis]|nr:DNA polymerase III subunit beta [Candidatus Fermentibacter daniensis]
MIKLLVSQAELLKGLNAVAAAVPPRTNLPALTNILVEAGHDQLKLAATDLDTTITTSVAATVTTPGAVAIPGRKLHEIVRELPEADVHISGTGNRISINCGESSFIIAGSARDSYPELPSKVDASSTTIPLPVLSSAIRRTSFAVAREDYRPALNGELWKLGPEGLEMVATDGHRLARIHLEDVTAPSFFEAIVAPKALGLLARMAEEGDVSVSFQGTQMSFEFGTTTIFSRTIEGPYPPYEKVIPHDNDKTLTISREDLNSALRRMRIIANPATHQVKLSLESGNILVQAENADAGEAKEKLEGEYSGKAVQVGFNADFLMEILKNMTGDRIVMKLKNSSSAVVLENETPEQGVSHLSLLMPVRLPGVTG